MMRTGDIGRQTDVGVVGWPRVLGWVSGSTPGRVGQFGIGLPWLRAAGR
jgi:hypothetical protein